MEWQPAKKAVIAYQSFNSNASKEHTQGSANAQQLTQKANEHAVGKGRMVDVLPTVEGSVTEPAQGPAHRIPVRKGPVYFSQSITGLTVTHLCGLLVQVGRI